MKQIVILIIVAVVGLAGYGIYRLVGGLQAADAIGTTAVAEFHERYNAGKDREILDHASKAFKSSTSLSKLQEVTNQVRNSAGKLQGVQRVGLHVNSLNGDSSLTMSFNSTFEKGPATEEFVFDYNGPAPQLSGYRFTVKSGARTESLSVGKVEGPGIH